MAQPRKLTIMDTATDQKWLDSAIRVAFCSTDMQHVDQHFGSASAFVCYAVTMDQYKLLEVVEFGNLAQDGNEDKLITKIKALEGCVAVYLQAVGASAIKKLTMIGVQPVKVSHGAPINELLEALQSELREGPRSWLARALDQEKNMNRFDDMEMEGWSE
ncbi:MAG: nitrogen fixation protein NifX [Methylocystaceae bacterium]|nr:nitrogen fixation protein NifX [Methylocystaceae bacterium]